MQNYQGDVSIISNNKVIEISKNINFKKLPVNGLVVADGEITGHKHLITAEPTADVLFGQDENGYFLKINSGEAILTHPEHGNYTLTTGIYFFGVQFEYDEIRERKVLD